MTDVESHPITHVYIYICITPEDNNLILILNTGPTIVISIHDKFYHRYHLGSFPLV